MLCEALTGLRLAAFPNHEMAVPHTNASACKVSNK